MKYINEIYQKSNRLIIKYINILKNIEKKLCKENMMWYDIN